MDIETEETEEFKKFCKSYSVNLTSEVVEWELEPAFKLESLDNKTKYPSQ